MKRNFRKVPTQRLEGNFYCIRIPGIQSFEPAITSKILLHYGKESSHNGLYSIASPHGLSTLKLGILAEIFPKHFVLLIKTKKGCYFAAYLSWALYLHRKQMKPQKPTKEYKNEKQVGFTIDVHITDVCFFSSGFATVLCQ